LKNFLPYGLSTGSYSQSFGRNDRPGRPEKASVIENSKLQIPGSKGVGKEGEVRTETGSNLGRTPRVEEVSPRCAYYPPGDGSGYKKVTHAREREDSEGKSKPVCLELLERKTLETVSHGVSLIRI